MKISNPFVFQLLTFFAVKEQEEFKKTTNCVR